jgi:hypothetical protein
MVKGMEVSSERDQTRPEFSMLEMTIFMSYNYCAVYETAYLIVELGSTKANGR